MSIFNTIWSSTPFINAIFTIAFFVLIRVYTRSGCDSNGKSEDKEGMKDKDVSAYKKNKLIDKITSKAKETVEEVKNTLSGMSDVTGCDLNAKCDMLDTQTYGEIFAAAFLSGCVVRLGWGA